MKRLIIITVALIVSVFSAGAQRLIIGERAPEVKTKEWLTAQPSGNKARLLEFFHTSSQQSEAHLATLDQYQQQYGDKLNIIVIAREPKDKVEPVLTAGQHDFTIALDDDGKTFSNFTVQFVPFSVLIDSKGRVVWFGNSTSLDTATIEKAL